MATRFEIFTRDISTIYKSISRIKRYETKKMGLKSTHVMCLNFLDGCPEGLTPVELCNLTKEDKSGISRTLADLQKEGLITYAENPDAERHYKEKVLLTEEGQEKASQVTALAAGAVERGGQGLTDEERQNFYHCLSVISSNLEKFCDGLDK